MQNFTMIAIRFTLRIITLVTAFVIMFLTLKVIKVSLGTTVNMEFLHVNKSTSATSPNVPNVVLPATFDYRSESFDCRTTSLMNMAFPVCHYTFQNDDTVTRYLLLASTSRPMK